MPLNFHNNISSANDMEKCGIRTESSKVDDIPILSLCINA